jgi:predicted Zn-dependent protease
LILLLKLRHASAMHRLLPVLCAGALLAGCQMATRAPQRVEPVAVVAPRAPSPAEEAIGARENPRVVAEYGGVYSDPDVEAAVAKVVARLVAASDDPSRNYRVTILNSPVANAFALPGGYLYVTRGLIALTTTRRSWPPCCRTRWRMCCSTMRWRAPRWSSRPTLWSGSPRR